MHTQAARQLHHSSRAHQHTIVATAAAAMAVDTLTITTPDDWHLHVRDGEGMRSVVQHTAMHFRRAIIMPNLVPPVTTTDMVGGSYA